MLCLCCTVSDTVMVTVRHHTYFTGVDHDAVLQAAVDDPALHQSDGQVQCEAVWNESSAYVCLGTLFDSVNT